MSFPIGDPQMWIVTAIAAGSLGLLLWRLLRQRSNCGSCSSESIDRASSPLAKTSRTSENRDEAR